MARRAYRITGRVQGVGFRWWTRKSADSMGLRGTVRNAEDGSVEVEVEGVEDVLDRFEARLHDGPPPASVEEVARREPGPGSLPDGFRILR